MARCCTRRAFGAMMADAQRLRDTRMNSSRYVAAAWALATAAQATAQPAPAAPASLPPVVVTATPGIAQRAFDTPASVDVIDGATLRNGQLGVNLSESLVRVPGITALNRQNYAQDLQISSRGYGARSTFGVRGLRLYVDGIPATAPDGQSQVSHFDLATADRLEVLRGPFSALYGNSSGGVISLFTADGGPETVAEVGSAFGSDGVQRHTVRLSGQQGALRYTLGGTRFQTEGTREHSAARRTGWNGKLRWAASEDTQLTLLFNQVDLPGVQDPLGLTRAELQADPGQASPAALQFDTRKSVDQQQVGAVLEHRLDAMHSFRFTGWRGQRGTEQYQSIPVAVQAPDTQPGGVIDLARDYHGADARWTLRTRAAGAPLTVTAGIAADRLREQRRGFQNFTGAGADRQLGVRGALRRHEENRVASLDHYVQAVRTGERFSLTAGVRRSRITFASADRFVAGSNGDDSGGTRFAATSPVLGLVFHAADGLNLYASAGRGFETPTFNELAYRPGGAGLNFALQPARSRQWEVGAKAMLASEWQLTGALFQARTTDELVVLTNSGGRSTFQNAGRTRRDGAELSLQGAWGPGWSTQVAASWIDARYASDFTTCGAPPCTAPSVVVPAGRRMPGIPRASLFAELAWAHRPSGLETALELRHTGRMAVDDRGSGSAAASTLLALRVGLSQSVGRWTLREFVRVDNLADRAHVGSVIVNEGNSRFFEPGPGRSWLAGVNAAYRF